MYDRILVPMDGSDTALRGLQEAISLALPLKSQLQLLYVVDDYPLLIEMSVAANFGQIRDAMRQGGQEILTQASRSAHEQGVAAETHLVEITGGRVADMILTQAQALNCQLIVMGTHGRRGISRTVLGSDAEQVVRGAAVPVLLVRQPEPAAR